MTTRELLWEFGAQRRSFYNVIAIRKGLKKHSLQTTPDWESAYIDADLEFSLVQKPKKNASEDTKSSLVEEARHSDPTYKISKLEAANQGVVSVRPDESLEKVTTIMMAKDFSQIPVMTNERDVKGVVSWRSIGSRLALVDRKPTAKDYMDPAYEVRHSDSMFDLISMIVQRDYVLVRGIDARVTGIITGSDLSVQFQQISEPFLLLSEIENLLRLIIDNRFDLSELQDCKHDADDDRNIKGVADLTFGEYIRLLENEDRWEKFGVQIDRVTFCKGLDDVRRIRNDVMHFDPDGVTPDDLERLRDCTKFLRRLHKLVAN